MKVKVYYNLHKHCFSVQHKGLVIAHKDIVCLENAVFKVSEKGRQRVLATKRKNVHAFVVGDWIPDCEVAGVGVTYNPYKYSTFVRIDDLTPVCRSSKVRLENRNVTAVLPSFN